VVQIFILQRITVASQKYNNSCVNFLRFPQKNVKILKDLGNIIYICRSLDCSVTIATGYELDGRGVGVRAPVVLRFFYFRRRPDQVWGSPSFISIGYCGAIYLGVKRLWR
jgi:hypothetical protein